MPWTILARFNGRGSMASKCSFVDDCKTTLDELATFIDRIRAVAKPPGFFRRAKVAMDLTMYAGDISGFEEKIHKSNCAVQTMLSAIQVSLSLRGNETQDKILFELRRLKSSIEQSVQVAFHHSDGFSHTLGDPSDARVAYNLQNLARVAQNFHSSASSTASTIYGANANGASFWNIQSDAAASVMGGLDLTPNKRQQISQYIKQQQRMEKRKPLRHAPSSAAASVVLPSHPTPAGSSEETESNMSDIEDEIEERDDEADLESFLLSGLEEVAKDSLLSQDFAKAQSMLEKAIERHTGSTSRDTDFKQLQIQLAICYFFQHKWQLAEPLIDSIAKSKANFDPVVCNLLHALAIANLRDERFDKAIAVCKQALRGKRRLKQHFGAAAEAECNETLGLLATIYYFKGSLLDAEALRRKFSNGFSYRHPEHELEFIVKHPKLCQEVFGKKIVLDWRRGVLFELLADVPCKDILTPINEMDVDNASIPERSKISTSKKSRAYAIKRIKTYNFKNRKPTKKPLQTFHNKLRQYEHSNQDTAKEVVGLDNDESFGASGSDLSSLPPSRTGMSLRPSLTWRVVQFLGTFRRSATSRDDWVTPPAPDKEQIPSPLRPKFGKGFWSKSDSHIFKLKKAKTRLQKRKCDESVKTSFSVLNGEQQRLSWSQTNSTNPPADEAHGNSEARPWRYGVDTWLRSNSRYHTSSRRHYPDDHRPSNWVPATQILGYQEPIILELPNSSIERITTPKTLRRFVTMKDDGCADDGGDSLTPAFAKDTESKDPHGTTVSGQKLKLTILNHSGKPEGIPLVAHQPAKRSQTPIPDATEGTEGTEAPPPTSSFASSPSLIQPIPTIPEIIAKVLHDFKDGDTDELAVREKLEREFDGFIRRESQGLWVGESRRRQAWVPASYFNDLSPAPTTLGSSVETATSDARPEQARKRPSLPKLSVLDETPSAEEGVSFLETTQMDSTPSTPLPLLNRKFSWESEAKEENITIVPLQIDPQPAPLPQISPLPRKFSWSSDGSDQQPSTPDLIRSSSSSSSSTSSTSSTLSASTTLTGPILKFDPVIKDLIVVGSKNTSFRPGTHNLDDFLENLSKSIPDKKNKRKSRGNKSPSPTSKTEAKDQQNTPSDVDVKGETESQASKERRFLLYRSPTDIYQRMEEEKRGEKNKIKDSAREDMVRSENEGMIHRRHQLREKKKRRKTKSKGGVERFKKIEEENRGTMSVAIIV